jgi:hypothetical protein
MSRTARSTKEDNVSSDESSLTSAADTVGCESPGLTADDRKNLAALEAKLQMVRDMTQSVASRLGTAFYLYGPGGCGKSYAVLEELHRLKTPYRLYNSRMTGRGLFNALEAYPDGIHLLEDMEQLFHDAVARGVLRSALWGQTGTNVRLPQERLVTWTTYRTELQFVFTGGIIMTANRPLPAVPELDAVKTRIGYMHLAVGDDELIALMRKVSLGGFRVNGVAASPAECREVCDHLVEQARGLHRQMDMRTLINAFMDYLQWRESQSGCHWRDMVATRLKERPIGVEEVRTYQQRASQKQAELEVAREVANIPNRHERFRVWKEKTGKSEPTLYRRLEELGL